MPHFLKKLLRSVRHASTGFAAAYVRDRNFRLEVTVGGTFFLALIIVFWPLHPFALAILALAYGSILSSELHNTALETALNRLHPEIHESVKASKDIAGAGVLMSAIASGVAVLIVIIAHL